MLVKTASKLSARGSHPFTNGEEVYRGEIPSRLEERHAVIDDVLRTLNRVGAKTDPYVDRFHLDEALTNAMIHGNELDETRKVTVRAFFDGERWGYEVNDDGAGFDTADLDTADLDAREFDERVRHGLEFSQTSGHGLALIRATGGDLHFLRGGRTAVIVRRADHTAARGGPASQ